MDGQHDVNRGTSKDKLVRVPELVERARQGAGFIMHVATRDDQEFYMNKALSRIPATDQVQIIDNTIVWPNGGMIRFILDGGA